MEKITLLMEYGTETVQVINMEQLPGEATYDGTYEGVRKGHLGSYNLYTIHNEAGFTDYAVLVN